jgi:carbon storage regulator CsrA
MLVLTRYIGELLTIGPANGEGEERVVYVLVMGIRNGTVKFGIQAPEDVIILREEVAKRNKDSGN